MKTEQTIDIWNLRDDYYLYVNGHFIGVFVSFRAAQEFAAALLTTVRP